MPITAAQISAAQARQHAAAHDNSPQVRVVAGPGMGKSFAIEERVRWLLAQGVAPEAICAVSFTRASALDLRRRIQTYCAQNGQPTVTRVRVSTLHSLALRTLHAAGLLTAYPTDPLVLDTWELENIFDAEFGHAHGKGGKEADEAMHQINPRLKVLFMSGYTANALHESFVLITGVPFLAKPFGPGALARKVREVLDG